MRHATYLRDLTKADWVMTSITAKAEHEVGPLISKHGLLPPRLVMQNALCADLDHGLVVA